MGKFKNQNGEHTENTYLNFLSDILVSVEEQMKIEPLSKITYHLNQNARCRLCLYGMDLGYISWFIRLKLRENGNEFMYNLNKLLGAVLNKKDPILSEILNELVIDKALLQDISSKLRSINSDVRPESTLFKNALRTAYLLNRMMVYHNAVGDNFNSSLSRDPKYVNLDWDKDHVTKLFIHDLFGLDQKIDQEFSFLFTLNISMKSMSFFMGSVKRNLN